MWPDSPWLAVADYKEWARIDAADTADDVAISKATDTAQATLQLRAPAAWLKDTTEDPPVISWNPNGAEPMLYQAGLLLANRLMSRRNSPDGVVGVSDMGTATILSYDADINQLVAPWSDMVVA